MKAVSSLCTGSTMIKVKTFCCGWTAWHVYGWVSIIWLTFAVSISVTDSVKLQTMSEVLARCGENVTLTCNATSKSLEFTFFSWFGNNKTCSYKDPKPDPEVLCQNTTNSLHYTLSLTLLNMMPVDQGEYFCKLRSNQGAMTHKTVVKVQDCFKPSKFSINDSYAECCFSGVYPSGLIHWFQGDINWTDSASTRSDEDRHGRYNLCSTLDVKKGKERSQPYKCSLWIPSARKYLSHQTPILTLPISSGSIIRVQVIFIMVVIMTAKLIA